MKQGLEILGTAGKDVRRIINKRIGGSQRCLVLMYYLEKNGCFNKGFSNLALLRNYTERQFCDVCRSNDVILAIASLDQCWMKVLESILKENGQKAKFIKDCMKKLSSAHIFSMDDLFQAVKSDFQDCDLPLVLRQKLQDPIVLETIRNAGASGNGSIGVGGSGGAGSEFGQEGARAELMAANQIAEGCAVAARANDASGDGGGGRGGGGATASSLPNSLGGGGGPLLLLLLLALDLPFLFPQRRLGGPHVASRGGRGSRRRGRYVRRRRRRRMR